MTNKNIFFTLFIFILSLILSTEVTPHQKLYISHKEGYLSQNIYNINKNYCNSFEPFNNYEQLNTFVHTIKIECTNNTLDKNKEISLFKTNNSIKQNKYIPTNDLSTFKLEYYNNYNNLNKLQKPNNYNIFIDDKNEYTGNFEHLTFDTLIAFPEKALNNNNNYSAQYDENKITAIEFYNILHELYNNNYILINIFDIIDNTTMNKKPLYLPKNKKPIILSFNNVTYLSNYQNLGEIDKIIIDRNNKLATYTTKKSIQDRVQYDNEFIVILENFIQNHPNFSHNNAKGIIFFSGENGILGYNTNHKNASSKYEAKRVSEIIHKLKNLGWVFGSHNYTYKDENIKTDIEFAKDLSLWNKEIKPIIGNTCLYAYPYGIDLENNNTKKDLLISNGFNIFFSNDNISNMETHGNLYHITRIHISGKTLREQSNNLDHIFSCKNVYDYTNRTKPFAN